MAAQWLDVQTCPGEVLRRAKLDADGLTTVAVLKTGDVEVSRVVGGTIVNIAQTAEDAAQFGAEIAGAAAVAISQRRQRIPTPEVRDSSFGEFADLVMGAGS